MYKTIYIYNALYTHTHAYLPPTYLPTYRQTDRHTYMYAFFSYFVSARRFVSDITRLKSAGHLSNMAHLEVREQVGGMRPPAKTSGDGLQRQIFFLSPNHQVIRLPMAGLHGSNQFWNMDQGVVAQACGTSPGRRNGGFHRLFWVFQYFFYVFFPPFVVKIKESEQHRRATCY